MDVNNNEEEWDDAIFIESKIGFSKTILFEKKATICGKTKKKRERWKYIGDFLLSCEEKYVFILLNNY